MRGIHDKHHTVTLTLADAPPVQLAGQHGDGCADRLPALPHLLKPAPTARRQEDHPDECQVAEAEQAHIAAIQRE